MSLIAGGATPTDTHVKDWQNNCAYGPVIFWGLNIMRSLNRSLPIVIIVEMIEQKRVYSGFNACGNYTLCTLSIFHVDFPFGVK